MKATTIKAPSYKITYFYANLDTEQQCIWCTDLKMLFKQLTILMMAKDVHCGTWYIDDEMKGEFDKMPFHEYMMQ